MGILDSIFGSSPKATKVPTMDKNQQALLSQLLQLLSPSGQLGRGYGNALSLQEQLMNPNSNAVNQFAEPYMRQFEQQTVPGLAERFAGFGGGLGGGLSSSGFGQALSSAGGNLQAQLAQLKAGLGQQAASNLMGQYGQLTGLGLGQRPFGYTYDQGSQGLLGNFLSGLAPGSFLGF